MTYNESYGKTEDYADQAGIGTAETTSQRNGFPSHLKLALTDFESISEYERIRDELIEQGHGVKEIELHRRDGWDLWGRSPVNVRNGMYATPNDDDTYIIISSWSEESIDDVVFDSFIRDMEFETLQDFKRGIKIFETLTNECNQVIREDAVVLFLNPDNDYAVERIISEQDTGYSYDTHNYKLGLIVEWKGESEE